MQRATVYFFLGTAIGYALNYFISEPGNWQLNLFYAAAYGLAWALAYLLDDQKLSLAQKLGVSFSAMIVFAFLGSLLFGFEKAVPSVMKFSTVFVMYYLFASFRQSKSLRN